MNSSEYQQLLEKAWRSRLTVKEQERLMELSSPQSREETAAEAGLTDALAGLKDVPLASNFTSQVLQAVELENGIEVRRKRQKRERIFRWLPRLAFGCLLLPFGWYSYHQLDRHQRARNVAEISQMTAVPNLAVWEDYEAITRMPLIQDLAFYPASKTSPQQSPDFELLAAFETGE